MASVNLVVLLGNITRDPELKYLPSQTAVCELGMAINRHWTDASGEKKEEVTFVDLSAFGKSAETLSKFVHKGDPLHVVGRLKLDQWEAQDGSKRSKMRVIIDSFQLLGGKREGGYGGEQADDRQTKELRSNARQAVRQSTTGPRPRVNVPADPGMRQQAPVADSTDDEDLPF